MGGGFYFPMRDFLFRGRLVIRVFYETHQDAVLLLGTFLQLMRGSVQALDSASMAGEMGGVFLDGSREFSESLLGIRHLLFRLFHPVG